MAYVTIHKFKGGTKEQYEASLAAVHPKGGRGLPEGQIFHTGGLSADGYWTIVVVHESRESWERFRDNILGPRLKEGVKGGFTTMPEETTFEAYNLRSLPELTKMAKAA
jgi:hypothetical protein